jgi:hypothetical protein
MTFGVSSTERRSLSDYAEAMVSQEFPATIHHLGSRISSVVFPKASGDIYFKIEGENGKITAEARGLIPVGNAARFMVLNFAFESVTFERETSLVTYFGIGSEIGKVGTIAVKIPQNEEERASFRYFVRLLSAATVSSAVPRLISADLTLATIGLAVRPADSFVGFDRVGDGRELALFLGSLWASLKLVGTLDEHRMPRIGLS